MKPRRHVQPRTTNRSLDIGSIVKIEPVSATPFDGLLGSSADEGRAKPRYYSV